MTNATKKKDRNAATKPSLFSGSRAAILNSSKPEPVQLPEDDCSKCKGHGKVIERTSGEPEELTCDACNGTGDANPEYEQNKEAIMAAKKKSSKKTSKKVVEKTITTAAPIGRERKLLLRLSVEEYDALQAKAAKQGTSMANLLRTSAIG